MGLYGNLTSKTFVITGGNPWLIALNVTTLYNQGLINRARKKLQFQLVLLANSSRILLAWGHFLLFVVNDLVSCPLGK